MSGEKFEVKSRNSTPDSTGSNLLCYICHTSGKLFFLSFELLFNVMEKSVFSFSGPMNTCKDCNICFHSSCVSPGSLMCCTYCKRKRLSPDDGSSEDSGKEEFASKCPNVAESYSKLKEYIENHTDSDTAALYAGSFSLNFFVIEFFSGFIWIQYFNSFCFQRGKTSRWN